MRTAETAVVFRSRKLDPGEEYSSLESDVAYRTAPIYRRAKHTTPTISLNHHIRASASSSPCPRLCREINMHRDR